MIFIEEVRLRTEGRPRKNLNEAQRQDGIIGRRALNPLLHLLGLLRLTLKYAGPLGDYLLLCLLRFLWPIHQS